MTATTEADRTKQKRAETIKKLQAKAAGTSNEAEASTYIAKAQELMTKWAISDAELDASGDHETDEITSVFHAVSKSVYFLPTVHLWSFIAEANGVHVLCFDITRYGTNQGVLLVGWRSDIERVELMFQLIEVQVKRERNRQLPEMYRDPVYQANDRLRRAINKKISNWKQAFTVAYAVRIGQRLRDQAERTKHDVIQSTGSGTELVLVDREKRVDDFWNAMTGDVKEGKARKYDAAGYHAGHGAADSADLGNTRVGDEQRKGLDAGLTAEMSSRFGF